MRIFIITLLALLMACSSLLAVDFKVGGVYTAWAQTQHQFWLGKKDANGFKYEDNYVVQMLRFNVQANATDHLRVITRFDIAQGWWGVDNVRRSVERTGAGGGSALFDFKDTNFLFHVDQAFVEFDVPNVPITARIGRMWYGVGNKIMVDNNYDGIQFDLIDVLAQRVTLGWAKVNENGDNLNDQVVGTIDNRDADLYSLDVFGTNSDKTFSYNAFGFYYKDRSIKDMDAFLPDGLQFFKTRFSPQVTQLTALGASINWTLGKLKLIGEFDYLSGKDDIRNVDSTGAGIHGKKQMWDINDGNLSGYNLYLKANFAAADKVDVGGVIGFGSGDDDLTGGKGNVNKLRTSGFFYITEVWEDSIMPDEEGVTPQGLGAPNVRGYRELENSTILQVNTTLKPFKKFSAFLSYNYIMATNAVHAWASDGADDWTINPDVSSKNLGQEIDFNLKYQMMGQMGLIFRGGYFMPGDAAGYLINGNNVNLDAAWELKGMVLYKF